MLFKEKANKHKGRFLNGQYFKQLRKTKKKHEALSNAFYEVEILLSLEDNFSFLNQLEFHIRNFFGIKLELFI